MRRILALTLLTLLTACAGEPSDETQLSEVGFADLPGWQYDHHGEAFAVFAESCRANMSRANAFTTRMGDEIGDGMSWRSVCGMTQRYAAMSDTDARAFFEEHFTPYRVSTEREPFGQFTGYYEPMLRGSMLPTPQYRVPVYGVPSGYVKGQASFSRAQIEQGALNGRAPVLLYVDDPVMLFFLHIQGSGKVQLPDGTVIGLQYAAQNGHGYVAIGRTLKDMGALETVSLQTIRDWLYANPTQASAVMNTNPSYIFFTLAPGDQMAKGAMGIPLTPLRSVAIDDDRATYGVPTYIATTHLNYFTRQDEPLNRLLVSQDTGGALKGPHRGDIFFGRGEEAEWAAGQQNTRGEVFWLLPN